MEQLGHCWHTLLLGKQNSWWGRDVWQGCCFCGLKVEETVRGPEGHGPFFAHQLGGSHRNPKLDEPCEERAKAVKKRGGVEDAANTV